MLAGASSSGDESSEGGGDSSADSSRRPSAERVAQPLLDGSSSAQTLHHVNGEYFIAALPLCISVPRYVVVPCVIVV